MSVGLVHTFKYNCMQVFVFPVDLNSKDGEHDIKIPYTFRVANIITTMSNIVNYQNV